MTGFSNIRIIFVLALAFAVFAFSLNCSSSASSDTATATSSGGGSGTGTASGILRPETELLNNPCNWPVEEFSSTNHVSLTTGLAEGERAIDFTLKDTSGTSWNLGQLLQTKPVFMIFGSWM